MKRVILYENTIHEYGFDDSFENENFSLNELKGRDLIIEIGKKEEGKDVNYIYNGISIGVESESSISTNYNSQISNLIFKGNGAIHFYNNPECNLFIEVDFGVKLYLGQCYTGICLKVNEGGWVGPMYGMSWDQEIDHLEKGKRHWINKGKIYNEEEWVIKDIIE